MSLRWWLRRRWGFPAGFEQAAAGRGGGPGSDIQGGYVHAGLAFDLLERFSLDSWKAKSAVVLSRQLKR